MMSDGPWVSLSDDNWEGKESSSKLSDDYGQDLASRLPETGWPSGGCGRAFARVLGARHAGTRAHQAGNGPPTAGIPSAPCGQLDERSQWARSEERRVGKGLRAE